jgi:hypothetical protein
VNIVERMNDVLLFLRDRKKAYQLSLSPKTAHGDMVLRDLARFCRAWESCVIPGDHDRTLLLEGRREVWLRIQQHLKLTDQELYNLYNGKAPHG